MTRLAASDEELRGGIFTSRGWSYLECASPAAADADGAGLAGAFGTLESRLAA